MNQKKKSVSSTHLCWLMTNRIREISGFPPTLSLAIVSDAKLGWRVVVATRSKFAITPDLAQRLERVQEKLRESYALLAD